MARPRTRRTEILEPFKRQFYQWYFTDRYTIYQVTVLFNWLFLMLHNVNKGDYYSTDEQDWNSRLREWNKVWHCRKNQHAGSQPAPSISGEIWFKKNGPKGLILIDKDLLPVCGRATARPDFIASVEYPDTAEGPGQMPSRPNTRSSDLCPSHVNSNSPPLDAATTDSFNGSFSSTSNISRETPVQLPTSHKPVIPNSAIMARGLASDSPKVYRSPYSTSSLPTRTELPTRTYETIDPRELITGPHGAPEGMSPGREHWQFPSFTAHPSAQTNGPWDHFASQNNPTNYQDYAFAHTPSTACGSAIQSTFDTGTQFYHDYEASAPYLGSFNPSYDNYVLHQDPNASSQADQSPFHRSPGQNLSRALFSTPSPLLHEQGFENTVAPARQKSRLQKYSGSQHQIMHIRSSQPRSQNSPIMPPVPADRILRSDPSPTGTNLYMDRTSAGRTQAFSNRSSRFSNQFPRQGLQ